MNILNKLTKKHLKMNKKRTIVSIVGILLSTALMVGIGLLMSTLRENAKDMIIADSGDAHAAFYNISQNDLEYIKKDENIKKYINTRGVGYSEVYNEDNYELFIKVIDASNDYFQKQKLKEGRYPTNNKEVVVTTDYHLDYKIGDTIDLEVGILEILEQGEKERPKSQVINTEKRSYKIVGIIERDVYEPYADYALAIYSLNNNIKGENNNIYIYYKNIRDVHDNTDNIKNTLNIPSEDIFTNDALASLSGASRYDNLITTMMSALVIILVILSIGCIVVIYNSFAISVMERKKQFGLLSSIGTTKKQIRKTVFFEALIVGTSGIVLGIVGAYIGIGIVLEIINKLVPDVFGESLKLVTYPIFILIPLVFMIITIILSALLPAYRASRITPIEAIRLNDDIKIKGKKVKTPKFIRKLFGVEGEIALKNIKRNKKRYRITVLSLFISIVLFITFSSYMQYMFAGVNSYSIVPDFDVSVNLFIDEKGVQDPTLTSFREQIIKNKEVKKYLNYNEYYLRANIDLSDSSLYNDKFYDLNKATIKDFYKSFVDVKLLEVDSKTYQELLKKLNKTETKPILYNQYDTITYSKNTRKSYSLNKYSSSFNKTIPICETIYEIDELTQQNIERYDCQKEMKDYYISNQKFYSSTTFSDFKGLVIIIPNNYFGDLTEFNDGRTSGIFITAEDDKVLEKNIESLNAKYNLNYEFINIKEEYRMMNNLIFCIKMLVYGFISLVTLIGVTSVFNTINTSIHLRRKEFAMLRSMGLSNRGFNKMLLFESFFFGIKSLIYALPVSVAIIYLLHKSFKDMAEFNALMLPYNNILLAVIGVFIIILISTIYATRKIRHENILEAIREENI